MALLNKSFLKTMLALFPVTQNKGHACQFSQEKRNHNPQIAIKSNRANINSETVKNKFLNVVLIP